ALEMDEVYIGGRPRYRMSHEEYVNAKGTPRERKFHGEKIPVIALVERDGKMRMRAVPDVKPGNLRAAMRELIDGADRSATLNTDESRMYERIGKEFAAHRTVYHSKREYHRHADDAGINTVESAFALFRRGLHGAFHHVSKRHLQRYADEF